MSKQVSIKPTYNEVKKALVDAGFPMSETKDGSDRRTKSVGFQVIGTTFGPDRFDVEIFARGDKQGATLAEQLPNVLEALSAAGFDVEMQYATYYGFGGAKTVNKNRPTGVKVIGKFVDSSTLDPETLSKIELRDLKKSVDVDFQRAIEMTKSVTSAAEKKFTIPATFDAYSIPFAELPNRDVSDSELAEIALRKIQENKTRLTQIINDANEALRVLGCAEVKIESLIETKVGA